MKIKWRVSLVMILLCLGMILLESTITMVQLKGNMEREHDQVIQKTSLQTALSFSYISDDIELFIFNMCRSEGVAATLLYTDTAYSKMVQINGFLRSITESTEYINSAYLIDERNGDAYCYPDGGESGDVFWTNRADGLFETGRDIKWHCAPSGQIYLQRAIYNIYPYRRVGSVVIEIDRQSLLSMLGVNSGGEEFFCIFDSADDLILNGCDDSEKMDLVRTAYQRCRGGTGRVTTITYGERDYDCYVLEQENLGWNTLYVIDRHVKMAAYYGMNTSIWVLGVILAGVGICAAFLLAGSVTRRITTLTRWVQSIGAGELKSRIALPGRDEIAELAENFNQTLDRIEQIQQDLLEKQIREEKMQYELLDLQLRSVQARIAPHFISNLLAALNSYAAIGETEKVERLAVHASRYFRKNIEGCERKLSTVEEEFRTIDEYVLLYQGIFGCPEAFSTTFLDDGAREMMMPSLFLQPLVENSLKYYRSESSANETSISLSAGVVDGKLQIILKDSSGQLPQDVQQAIREFIETGKDSANRLGFGLAGTLKRLRLMYQKAFAFQIINEGGSRKQIVITIPAVTVQEHLAETERGKESRTDLRP